LAQPLSLPFIIENLNIWACSAQQFNFKRSKIDKEDEEIFLKELCELENLVCTKTVYTPENGQLEKVFFYENAIRWTTLYIIISLIKRQDDQIFKVKKITNNRKLIIYDPIPRVKTSPCL
jgi:hypothetical protein